jgi:hypothetical protein
MVAKKREVIREKRKSKRSMDGKNEEKWNQSCG